MALLAGLGRSAMALAEFVGSASVLLGRAAGYLARGQANARGTLAQMSVVGTDSLPIAVVTLVFAGMVLGLHTAREMVRFGGGGFVGGMVAVSVTRELGPTLTGIVVAARVGSAMAAEIGSMKITEQVDALRALAVSPTQYLVVPRLLACAFMLPVLTVFADFAGAWGAYVIAVGAGVSEGEYLRSARQFMDFTDFFGGLSKTVVFGIIIAVVGCQQGFATRGGASGVGHSTTRSVVISIMLIYIANYLLSALIFRAFG
jgi:phospholipid/cholesterol/gamma-HCH transport system permease protein